MKIKEGREQYFYASGTLSATTRQLALAGIGIIWLLAGGLSRSKVHLSGNLLAASILMLASLAGDLSQSYWQASRLRAWTNKEEKALDDAARQRGHGSVVASDGPTAQDREIGDPPDKIAQVAWRLFQAKVTLMGASYVLIVISLVTHIRLS